MTRPKPPRLPELAGMTEAGFNRVVAMITPSDFIPRHGTFGAEWAWGEWRASLPRTSNKKQRKAAARRRAAEIDAVRASQPAAPIPWTPSVSAWVDGDTPRAESWGPSEPASFSVSAVPCAACGWTVIGTASGTTHPCRCGKGTYVIGDHWLLPMETENERIARECVSETPPEGDVFVDGMPFVDALEAAVANQTPLQRLMRFAAEDGTPVSFEIAEAAMKGEW